MVIAALIDAKADLHHLNKKGGPTFSRKIRIATQGRDFFIFWTKESDFAEDDVFFFQMVGLYTVWLLFSEAFQECKFFLCQVTTSKKSVSMAGCNVHLPPPKKR